MAKKKKYTRFISVSKNLDIKVLVYKAVSFNIGTWSITSIIWCRSSTLMLVQRCGILVFPGNNFENDKNKIILLIISNKYASGGDRTRIPPVMLPYQYFSIFFVTG
jgi:hypothetical protein